MRLDTFHYQRMLRYRYNAWRMLGYAPAAGLLAAWFLENGCLNFYSYVINKPKSGVPRRQEGEDTED